MPPMYMPDRAHYLLRVRSRLSDKQVLELDRTSPRTVLHVCNRWDGIFWQLSAATDAGFICFRSDSPLDVPFVSFLQQRL